MSLTSTFQMSTSSPSITATSSAVTTPTDPAWLGWITVQDVFYSGTPVYSPGSCGIGSTFLASSTFAGCCGTNAPCTIFSSCSGGSELIAAGGTSTCGAFSTCKTDYIYQTAINGVETSPTAALYCETGLLGATWFRSMPTPGIALSAVPTSSAQSGNDLPWGGIGGGVGAGIFLLICFAIVCCLCRGCCGSSGRGHSSGGRYLSRPSRPSRRNDYPMDSADQTQREQIDRMHREAQRSDDDYYRRQAEQADQAERDRRQALDDQAYRDQRAADQAYRDQQAADQVYRDQQATDQAYRDQQNQNYY